MTKQFLLRHLWRRLQHRPKMVHIRSLNSAPRREPFSMGSRFVLTDAAFVAVPTVICLTAALFYHSRRKEYNFLEEQMKLEPIPLPDNVMDLANKEMKYRLVKVHGQFDHTMESYIRPRERIPESDSVIDIRIFVVSENSGILVVTPFTLKGTGERILINRGWIPADKLDPRSRLEGQIEGEVELVGAVQHSERERFVLNNASSGAANVYYTRDVESLAKSTNSLPVYLDAVADSTVAGGPIGGQIAVELKAHLVYYLSVLYLPAFAFLIALRSKRSHGHQAAYGKYPANYLKYKDKSK